MVQLVEIGSPAFEALLKEVREATLIEARKSIAKQAKVDKWLTVEEAMEMLSCGRSKVIQLDKSGLITSSKVSTHKRLYSQKSIEEYITDNITRK